MSDCLRGIFVGCLHPIGLLNVVFLLFPVNRFHYDNVLTRLMVREDESYYGLQSGAAGIGSLDQDPPIFACRFAETSGYEHILALANEDGRVAIQVGNIHYCLVNI